MNRRPSAQKARRFNSGEGPRVLHHAQPMPKRYEGSEIGAQTQAEDLFLIAILFLQGLCDIE
jgi:hypothetical protein